jgi:hypothetical protein
MKTIEINVYSFNELSDDAKENAIEQYRENNYGFHWSEDYLQSAIECLKIFGGKLKDYSIDWSDINRCHWKIYVDEDDISELTNSSYYLKYINGEKYPSGFCADDDFFSVIKKYIANPYDTTFEELINDCLYELFHSACKDYEHQISDEGITESIQCNEYQFTEDGNIY